MASENRPSFGSSSEVLELQRNHDSPGWDCLQRRASGSTNGDETRYCAEAALQSSGNSILRQAQDVVYWSGMKKDIEQAVRRCAVCEENTPALPKEEGWAHEIMGRLLEKVGMDLFHCRGKDFLIMVDYLTDFF